MNDDFDMIDLVATMDEIAQLEHNLDLLADERIYVEKLLAATKTLSPKTGDIVTASRVYLHYAKAGDFMVATPSLEQLMELPTSVIRDRLVENLEAISSAMDNKLGEWFKKLIDLFNSMIAYNRILEKKIQKELSDGKLSDIRNMNVQAYKSITVPFFTKHTFISVVKRLTDINYMIAVDTTKGSTFKEMVDPGIVNTLAEVGQIVTDENYTYDKSKIETNKPISALGWSIDDLVPAGKNLVALLNANAIGGRRAIKMLKTAQKALNDGEDIISIRKKISATKKIYTIIQRTAITLAKLFMQLVKRLKK